MIFARMVLFATMSMIAGYFVTGDLNSAFSSDQVIKVSGVLNMWADYGAAIIGAYLTLYFTKEQFELSLRIGDFNRVIVFVALLIAPALAVGTYSKAMSNVGNYVECKDERQVSSRYSSRTYALTDSQCQTVDPIK